MEFELEIELNSVQHELVIVLSNEITAVVSSGDGDESYAFAVATVL